jgi:putative SOS response-associated peptidase YedK
MCYDVSFAAGVGMIRSSFEGIEIGPEVSFDDNLLLHVQAQAFRKYPVVIMGEKNYQLKMFEWGIIPEYMNTPEKIKKGRSSMCNARSEKIIDDHRSYWHRIRKQRCLIPVTGIFEHREVKGFKNKIPYLVTMPSRPLFFLPGLYHYPLRADVETGEITGTFTVITRPANSLMAMIHNSGEQAFRMPLFLQPQMEKHWLQKDPGDEEMKRLLDYELPSEELKAYPVFTIRTTKERPDGLSKIDTYDWPGLPALGNDDIQAALFST